MTIKAKCKYDSESIQALTHLWIYKKAKPQKALRSRIIFFAILLFVVAAEFVIFGYDPILLVLLILDILILVLDGFMHFCVPKIQYNALGKMKNAENEYFFCDNVVRIITKSEGYSGETEIQYSMFVKVYETSRYFFLYQANNQVYIVDKATAEGGTPESVGSVLFYYVKDKYIRCKY